ncbi:hypothetical protein KKA08_05350, partial [bacterium]|nr:hypothetical protein [bacterium]
GMLENVQCEACHGSMGPTIYDHEPIVNLNTGLVDDMDPSMCSKCHEQVEEWQESGHGMVFEHHGFVDQEEFDDEWNRSSCGACHTGEGFIGDNDPNFPDPWYPEDAHLIGCQTCHDPHDDTNPHQLRNVDDYTVLYDAEEAATFTGYGGAQTCVQCHHARRNTDNVVGQIENGYAHFGPHGSPQMDMFVGSGSYEIEGYEYEREHSHQMFDMLDDNESCVTCHMEMRDHGDPLGWKGGHDFEPTPATCSACHVVPDDFDYHGEPSDLVALADQLITAIGVDPEYLGNTDSTTVEQRMAGYAYVFFMNDGSNGIHNPEYARSLLENALDFIETANAAGNGAIVQK